MLIPAVAVAQPSPTGGYRGPFNNHDQGHADFCVRLKQPVVELRYPDGKPSGYHLTTDMLVPVEGNGVSCPQPGMARLDAREVVTLADGRTMLFHRGGWGFVGNDPESAVHFGHVLITDIDTVGLRYERNDSAAVARGEPRGRWFPAPTRTWTGPGQQAGNGSACPSLAREPLHIAVQSLPDDMRYLSSNQQNAIRYTIYGNPSGDLGPAEDRAKGVKYTMLEWSWINTRGGGVARAILEDGTPFYRCDDVPAIQLASVADAASKRITGWVSAVYGAVKAGNGALLYGWAVYEHQREGEAVVKHMRPQ